MNIWSWSTYKTVAASLIFAVATTNVSQLYADDTGGFIGITANRVSADFKDVNDVDFDDSDTAFGIRGGYMFTDMIGVEVGYLDLGDYVAKGDRPANRIDLDADAFTVAVVLNWSVADQVDVYGKIGAYYIDADRNSVVAGQVLREGDDDTSAFGAIGVEYDLGAWNPFIEYTRADTDAHNLDIDIISLGVKYEFSY